MDGKQERISDEQRRKRYRSPQGPPPVGPAEPHLRADNPGHAGASPLLRANAPVVSEPPQAIIYEKRAVAETVPPGWDRNRIVARIVRVIDYLFYVLYGLLAIRFVLGLFGANQDSGFVQFIHSLTEPFYAPFAGIVDSPTLGGSTLDLTIIIAFLAYLVLQLLIRGLFRLFMNGGGRARVA